MGSGRHDADTWDLASSVGATATMSAAVRALVTRTDPDRLDDPFAEPLVRAVGVDVLTRLARGEVRRRRVRSNSSGSTSPWYEPGSTTSTFSPRRLRASGRW
jgi:O-methyltransferase involved in polyketide biosynthesis